MVDLDGNPLRGVPVGAFGGSGKDFYRDTEDDGSFAIAVPDGQYSIFLGRSVGATADRPYVSVFWGGSLGYNRATEYGNACTLTAISVEGADVNGIVIRIAPELLTRTDNPMCNEGQPGRRMLMGDVRGPDGEPQIRSAGAQYHLLIWVESARTGDYLADGEVGSDGTFAIAVPTGSRVVLDIAKIGPDYFGRRIGWYRTGTGFTTIRSQATAIDIGESDVTGIVIQLPAALADLVWLE